MSAWRRRLGWYAIVLALLAALGVGFIMSVATGTQALSWEQVVEALGQRHLLGSDEATPQVTVVWNLRLPRAILALLVGLNLALAGAQLQGVMRNPLASPDIIGVTAGAALAATILIAIAPALGAFGWLGIMALPAVAFVSALIVAATVFVLSWQPGVGASPVRMILAGVAISAMIGGFQAFLMVYFSDRVQGVVLWLTGSLNTRSWHHVGLVAPCTVIGATLAFSQIRALDLLQLGEEAAQALGVHINRTRTIALISASLLTAAVVCTAGVIGFVGLIVPHIARLTVGHQHNRLLPTVALAGAAMVIWADVIARLMGEMPVGVLTAVIGGPYFVFLLRRRHLI